VVYVGFRVGAKVVNVGFNVGATVGGLVCVPPSPLVCVELVVHQLAVGFCVVVVGACVVVVGACVVVVGACVVVVGGRVGGLVCVPPNPLVCVELAVGC